MAYHHDGPIRGEIGFPAWTTPIEEVLNVLSSLSSASDSALSFASCAGVADARTITYAKDRQRNNRRVFK
jgi:hypothetical protein